MLLEQSWANESWNRCLGHYIGTEERPLWRNRRFLCIVLNGPMSIWLTPQWPVDWPDAIIFFLQHISPKIPTERKHSNYTASKQGVTARIRGLRHRRLIVLQKIALTIRWVFCYFVINGMFLVWPITLLYNTPRALVGFLQLPMCHTLTLLKMSKPHGCCLDAPKQQQI